MHTPSGRFSIVFNGEIYNYLELKKELKSLGIHFKTNSDTEVLLAAWEHWGEDSLKRLVGMFAFAIFDRNEKRLTCVRDGFGIKPLLFAYGDGAFVFGSEIGAIKALRPQPLELDWQRAYDYLVHGDYDNGPRSFVAGVSHVLPGHLVTLDTVTGELKEQLRWWQPEIVQHDIGYGEATEAVREKFLNSIRVHLRSDVAIGAALSGGLDSSAVVCAMRHLEPDLKIKTFSFIARDNPLSEEFWVDQVNHFVGAEAHKVLVKPEDLARDLDDMIKAQGEPFGSTSIYAQYRVFEAAKAQGVIVTLDGQGADEALQIYRETFRPSAGYAKPHAALCLWALVADTDEEALRLFESRARWKMDRNLGRIGALLPPEVAARDYSPAEQLALQRLREGALIGSAATVGRKLRQLAARLEVQELVVITWTHDPAAQMRSYELLAQEFGLTANSLL
jgi:asparagine synthase (glutamine-hydrolysing)